MFGKKEENVPAPSPQSGKVDTILGPDVKLTGTITGKGSLRIEGEVDGEIDYDGSIVVGENATVKASVNAKSVTIAGEIQGNVTVESRLNLVSTGKLIGDMNAETFIVAEGAVFQGHSDMASEEEEEESEEQESSSSWPEQAPRRRPGDY